MTPDIDDLAAKAAVLRNLHHGPDVLLLPNAWDVASARIFEEAGFDAVATTSAGVANTLGIDLSEAILGKLKKNALKYPADQYQGRYSLEKQDERK